MRIVCPSCTATYDVPAELVAGRPVVRCVQCTQEWKLGEARTAALAAEAVAPDPILDHANLDPIGLARIPPEVLGRPATRPEQPAGAQPENARAHAGAMLAEEPGDLALASRSSPADRAPLEPDNLVLEDDGPDEDLAALTARMNRATEAALVAPTPIAAPIAAPVAPRRLPALALLSVNLVATLGWAFTLGILVALSWMAVQHRSGIMHAWPPSQRLFGWLGLA